MADELGGTFVRLDVGDPEAWPRLLADAEQAHGGIDLAHLNAGIALGAYPVVIENVTDDEYRRIMGVNVDGVFFGVRALVPAITKRGGGAIVVTASLAGVGPHPDDPVYAATKHFVVGLVRSLGYPLRGARHHDQRGVPRGGRHTAARHDRTTRRHRGTRTAVDGG